MSRRGTWGALALVLLLALVSPRPALANMARSFWSGDTHGPLMAQGATTVRVDAEELSFTMTNELGPAEVIARYRMTNTGAAPSGGDVAFVFVHGESERYEGGYPAPVITIDGVAAEYRTIDGADLSGQGHGSWSQVQTERLGWLVFRLDFAAGQARTVEVHYYHRPARDLAERVNPTFTYEYLLSPAKSWAAFGPLHLRLSLPADTELVSSTIPLVRDGNGYRADLAGLPDGELTFKLMSTRGLWFGMSSPSSYFRLLCVAMALLVFSVSWFAGRKWRRDRPARSSILMVLGLGLLMMPLAGLALAGVAEVLPRHALGFGYADALSLIGLWFLSVLGSMIVGGFAVRGRVKPPAWDAVDPTDATAG